MDPIDLQIGARLRAMRELHGMTQMRLAAMAGVTPEEISRCEAGDCPTPVALVMRLAQALHASAAELIAGERDSWRNALEDMACAGPDGSVELLSAFNSIPDKRVRRAFLDLTWSIAEARHRKAPDD